MRHVQIRQILTRTSPAIFPSKSRPSPPVSSILLMANSSFFLCFSVQLLTIVKLRFVTFDFCSTLEVTSTSTTNARKGCSFTGTRKKVILWSKSLEKKFRKKHSWRGKMLSQPNDANVRTFDWSSAILVTQGLVLVEMMGYELHFKDGLVRALFCN